MCTIWIYDLSLFWGRPIHDVGLPTFSNSLLHPHPCSTPTPYDPVIDPKDITGPRSIPLQCTGPYPSTQVSVIWRSLLSHSLLLIGLSNGYKSNSDQYNIISLLGGAAVGRHCWVWAWCSGGSPDHVISVDLQISLQCVFLHCGSPHGDRWRGHMEGTGARLRTACIHNADLMDHIQK